MVTQAQKLAKKKYQQDKRDLITTEVPKGKREEYKSKAALLGISLAQLIQRGVESYGVGNESVLPTTTTTQSEPALTSEQRKILDAFDALPEDAKKALIKFLLTLNKNQDNA